MLTEITYDLCSARHCNICLLLQREKTHTEGEQKVLEEYAARTTTLPELQKCSGCQLVLYCDASHQKMDWPLHRDFCRAAQKIMTNYHVRHPYLLNGAPKSKREMERTILQVKFLLRTMLGRALLFHEEELSSFPAYCAVCFSFKRLQPCPYCIAVSYCSAEHASEDAAAHKRICGKLQLFYCVYKVQSLPVQLIKDFYRRVPNLHKTDLVDAFQQATLKRLPAQPNACLECYQLFATAADFSCIGTLCYALGFVDMRCYDNAKFVVFIVGATIEQDLWFREVHTKFFFLQFSQISKLELYFIGPKVTHEGCLHITYNFQGLERSVLYTSYRGLFQHFIKAHNIRPSIIIAYNCGFSEHVVSAPANTWADGILEMLQTYDVPIIFTSFTSMEADFDFGIILNLAQCDQLRIHVERIFNVKQNPYRDLRPLRSWNISDKEEIYYRNGYVQAVRTKLEL